MPNPILEKLEEVVKLNEEMKTANDARIEKIEKGHMARADELESQVSKINADLAKALKERDTSVKQEKAMQDRIEMLEALADRPKGTAQEQLESKYLDTFVQGIRTQFKDSDVLSELQTIRRQAKEIKDITIGTDSAGGFAVPKEIGSTIDKLILNFSDIAANVRNIRVGTSDYQELVSIHGSTSGWVGETGTRSATGTSQLRNIKPTWGELYAYPQISEWSAQDVFFNVADWLTEEVGEDMAVTLSTSIWNGDGSDKPTGMTNSAPTAADDYASPMRAAAVYEFINVTGSPATTVAGDDLINLVYGVRKGYRQMAKFAMNSTVQGEIRKLKDSNGQYLWQPSLQAGQPDMLLGYELLTWEDMDDVGTLNNLPIAFGNWNRAFLLVHRNEMLMNVDQVTNPGYIRFYLRRRWAGIPKNNDAVKFLKLA